MIPILELYYKDLISTELNLIKSSPDIIDDVFKYSNYATKFKSFMANKSNRVNIVLGYPRNEQSEIPCICIMLGSEDEETESLGDFEDYETSLDDTLDTTLIFGTLMNFSYRMECWSDNSELSLCLYYVLKYIMLKNRVAMQKNAGIITPKMSGGDLEPVPEYFPFFVFRKALILSGKVENTFTELCDSVNKVDVNSSSY